MLTLPSIVAVHGLKGHLDKTWTAASDYGLIDVDKSFEGYIVESQVYGMHN